jgi:hypothetical protein
VDGSVVTDTANLFEAEGPPLGVSIGRDEFGRVVVDDVWTGSDPGGTATFAHCTNWTVNTGGDTAAETGTSGRSDTTGNWVVTTVQKACQETARLFCLQQ